MKWSWPEEASWKGEEGEIKWQNKRYIITMMNILPGIKKELMDVSGEVARTVVFKAAYNDSKEAVENVLSSNLAKLANKLGLLDRKVSEKLAEIIAQQGFGKAHVKEVDLPEEGRVIVENSFESQYYLDNDIETEKPVCDMLRGLIAGASHALTEQEMHAEEVKCRALGDDKCEFLISSERDLV